MGASGRAELKEPNLKPLVYKKILGQGSVRTRARLDPVYTERQSRQNRPPAVFASRSVSRNFPRTDFRLRPNAGSGRRRSLKFVAQTQADRLPSRKFMYDDEGSSPKPRSVSLLPLAGFLRSSQKLPHQSQQTKPLPHNSTDRSSPSLEFSLPGRPTTRVMPPRGCFLRIDRSEDDSLSEDQAVQQLVRRVGAFLHNNPNIHATKSKSENQHYWKCETPWLRFRVLVIDGSTIQVQRRFGCCYKLRQVQLALWDHCNSSTTTTRTTRPPRPAQTWLYPDAIFVAPSLLQRRNGP